jgi:hypothetical protein
LQRDQIFMVLQGSELSVTVPRHKRRVPAATTWKPNGSFPPKLAAAAFDPKLARQVSTHCRHPVQHSFCDGAGKKDSFSVGCRRRSGGIDHSNLGNGFGRLSRCQEDNSGSPPITRRKAHRSNGTNGRGWCALNRRNREVVVDAELVPQRMFGGFALSRHGRASILEIE